MRLVCASILFLVACSESSGSPREATIEGVLAQADAELIRSRPELAAGKYRRMAGDLYAFYRGTMPLFRHDAMHPGEGVGVTRFFTPGPLPLSIGDAHLENFGLLRAADGTLALEPNDFDAADRFPYVWDLRRLLTSLVIGARVSNPSDPPLRDATAAAALDIARACARAYADEAIALAAGAPRERIDAPTGTVLDDLFRRGMRDCCTLELDTLTAVDVEGTRHFVRGAYDPTDPNSLLLDLPDFAIAALHATVHEYRATLIAPDDESFFEILDAVQVIGTGVASWPRIRVYVLVRGPSDAIDDDVVLELKEIADSGATGYFPPGVIAGDNGERVRLATRAMWARPDAEPFWGVSHWLGLVVQLRRESEAHKTVRTSRFEAERGTPQALTELGQVLGRLLARAHSAGIEATDASRAITAIAAAISDPEAFADEHAQAALLYADRVGEDYTIFRDLLDRVGPRLGLRDDPDDRPSPELMQLFDTGGAP